MGVIVVPGTPPALAQLLKAQSSILNLVPEEDALKPHSGIDWKQWDQISNNSLNADFLAHIGSTFEFYM